MRSVRWLLPWLLSSSFALCAATMALAAEPAAERWKPTEPANQPLGVGQGIFPGRVVWIHNAAVAKWDGDTEKGGWFEDRFTDPALAAEMLSQSLRRLTGAESDAQAWEQLFRHHNRTHGRGDAGYQPGEKIAVKLNLNCSGSQRPDFKHGLYNTPQVTLALVRQLVNEAHVRAEDITLYDASRWVNDTIYVPVHAEFPGVRFEDQDGGDGRQRIEPDTSAAIQFADPAARASGPTCLPHSVTAATYLLNVAVLKGHSLAGVTLNVKNHFGSVYRQSAGPNDNYHGWNPSHLHGAITSRQQPMGTYNAMVDLMGHKDLGGKTILYLIDALYAAPHQSVLPERWRSAPFAGHWTASLFASQDPVAIESVAVDFSGAEPSAVQMVGAVDNYLHEAALAGQAPSGTRYDPEGDGAPLGSLGVHEHWNNPAEKKYSRNLGRKEGIELVCAAAEEVAGGDLPRFLPNDGNSVYEAKGLLRQWPAAGPERLWQIEIGWGKSSVVESGGLAFTAAETDDQQYALGLDPLSGEIKWKTLLIAQGNRHFERGPVTSPVVDGDRVYFIPYAIEGRDVWEMRCPVVCLKTDGSELWRLDKDVWATEASTPLVVGDTLYVGADSPDRAVLAAVDKFTGAVRWTTKVPSESERELAAPASLTYQVVDGVPQVIVATYGTTEVLGVHTVTGEIMWRYPYPAEIKIGLVSTPVAVGSRLFLCGGEGKNRDFSACLQMEAREGKIAFRELYRSTELQNNAFNTVAVYDQAVFGFGGGDTAGFLHCTDLGDGRLLWQESNRDWNRERNLVVADGLLFAVTRGDELAMAEASRSGYRELARVAPGIKLGRPQQPTIANGRLSLRGDREVVCYRIGP